MKNISFFIDIKMDKNLGSPLYHSCFIHSEKQRGRVWDVVDSRVYLCVADAYEDYLEFKYL